MSKDFLSTANVVAEADVTLMVAPALNSEWLLLLVTGAAGAVAALVHDPEVKT